MVIKQIEINHFGHIILLGRWLGNLTKTDLVKKTGLSKTTIMKLETGEGETNASSFFKLLSHVPLDIYLQADGGDPFKIERDGGNYGEIIQIIRGEMEGGAGWTLEKLRQESDLSQPTLSAMERGDGGRLSSFLAVIAAMKLQVIIKFNKDVPRTETKGKK